MGTGIPSTESVDLKLKPLQAEPSEQSIKSIVSTVISLDQPDLKPNDESQKTLTDNEPVGRKELRAIVETPKNVKIFQGEVNPDGNTGITRTSGTGTLSSMISVTQKKMKDDHQGKNPTEKTKSSEVTDLCDIIQSMDPEIALKAICGVLVGAAGVKAKRIAEVSDRNNDQQMEDLILVLVQKNEMLQKQNNALVETIKEQDQIVQLTQTLSCKNMISTLQLEGLEKIEEELKADR